MKRKINKHLEIYFVFSANFYLRITFPLNVCCVLLFAICVCPLQYTVFPFIFEKNKTKEKKTQMENKYSNYNVSSKQHQWINELFKPFNTFQ